jgi:hypothetical protein
MRIKKMTKTKKFTEEQVLEKLKMMSDLANCINNSAVELWSFSDSEHGEYHSYQLNVEMCAVWNMVSRTKEVLDNLIDLVSENVEEDDGNIVMEYIHNSEDKNE